MLHKKCSPKEVYQRMAALYRPFQKLSRKPIISQVPRNRPGPTPLQAVILVVNLPDVTKGCDIKPIEAIEMSLSCCSEDWNLCYHHLQAMRLEQPI